MRHGGGKRCKAEECGKSAQGRTDFCKAHGGGKVCDWAGPSRCGKPGRGRSGLCPQHAADLPPEWRVHGGDAVNRCSEGRVHGGSLLLMMEGDDGDGVECEVPRKWM